MDIIFIKGLKIEAIIGVFEWERTHKQPLILDLEMGHDIKQAAGSDELEYALDYKSVSDCITRYVEDSSFQLIETLAERIVTLVQQEFGVPWLRLTVGKPDAIPSADTVGLVIERTI